MAVCCGEGGYVMFAGSLRIGMRSLEMGQNGRRGGGTWASAGGGNRFRAPATNRQ